MNRKLPLLTLIGTVHRDPAGFDRLLALLRELSPTAITLEMSPFALAFRRERGPALRRRLARLIDELRREQATITPALAAEAAATRALLEIPFEYRAAAAWAGAAGATLRLIDLSAVSRRKLGRLETELLTLENLRTVAGLPVADAGPAAEGYGTARAMLGDRLGREVRQAYLEGRRGGEEVGVRDRWMARQIRRQLAAMAGGHLAHVGGWLHLLPDERRGETLFSRLRDLSPERILLG